MIDNVSILLSIVATAYVVFQAIRLDKTLPWFGERSKVPPVKPRR